MRIEALGPRICIIGPSNSGKSTLAAAIGRARNLPPIHLDQLYHRPNTDWEPRPAEEFQALHDAAILGPRWIMDGNYSRCLPQRLERATGLIVLDVPTAVSLVRYLRRTWFERDRYGTLEGGRDSVKWSMIRHIVVTTPANRKRYAQMFGATGLPTLRLDTPQALARFYRREGLSRMPGGR
ncbi:MULTISPECIES: AAA family ATPase [unclassified Methylobacterium]|uniref:AAA family ATPase n=1 Tax=unclassified Methylobacterium TaxID=2615210 RepID=UPI0013548AAF|nr:AAA family ATPase [Methylobacterium sp. 2A]MWV24919.1 AAA family ATPase [Methylobacterium sp. 2A]